MIYADLRTSVEDGRYDCGRDKGTMQWKVLTCTAGYAHVRRIEHCREYDSNYYPSAPGSVDSTSSECSFICWVCGLLLKSMVEYSPDLSSTPSLLP